MFIDAYEEHLKANFDCVSSNQNHGIWNGQSTQRRTLQGANENCRLKRGKTQVTKGRLVL